MNPIDSPKFLNSPVSPRFIEMIFFVEAPTKISSPVLLDFGSIKIVFSFKELKIREIILDSQKTSQSIIML